MCIVCHYRSDNKLVTPEVRSAEHKDKIVDCIRGTLCIDCHEEPVMLNHVCGTLPQHNPQEEPKRAWIGRDCPKCGASAGELCWGKGFDVYGPKTRRHKSEPCVARRRVPYREFPV